MRKKLYYLILIVLILVFLFSGWSLFSYFWEGYKTQSRYDDLAAMVDQARPKDPEANQQDPNDQEEGGILREYRDLYESNPDMVGWLSIQDTVIDYPVVQTPDRPEYYLHRDFDGSYNDRGCLFADANCDVNNSDNVIIYGHHMADGSMFASLINYGDKTYWEEHPEIRFDTLTERRTYQVFAVFRTTASLGQGFPYHKFIDAKNQEEFDQYVAKCKQLSPYDTGITPEYGDKLLCLSTCEYSQENGRFVVMAVYKAE